jgi:hypothetical protein
MQQSREYRVMTGGILIYMSQLQNYFLLGRNGYHGETIS